jgi:hypothetical protein
MANSDLIKKVLEILPGEVLVEKPKTDPRLRYFTPDEIELREKLADLLESADMAREASRLSLCGNRFIVLKCENEENHAKVRPGFSFCCESRICTRCSQKHANRVRRQLKEIINKIPKTGTHKFGHLMLSRKMYPGEILTPEILRTFFENVRKLINLFYPKNNNCGALATLEIGSDSLNLHAHVLVYGPYIPQRALSDKWEEITGDTRYVYIKAAYNQQGAVNYLTKYIAKPPSFHDVGHYILYLKAIKKVRRLHRFGILYNFKVEKREPLRCPICGGKLHFYCIADISEAEDTCVDYWSLVDSKNSSQN